MLDRKAIPTLLTLLALLIGCAGCAARRTASPARHGGSGETIFMPSGEWTVTSLTRLPAGAEPRRKREMHCLRDDIFDPAVFVPELENCVLTDRTLASTTTTWSIRCEHDGQVAAGFGELAIEGERADGGMRLELPAGEAVEAAWIATRIGPCIESTPPPLDGRRYVPGAAPIRTR